MYTGRNLPESVTPSVLRDVFRPFGTVIIFLVESLTAPVCSVSLATVEALSYF